MTIYICSGSITDVKIKAVWRARDVFSVDSESSVNQTGCFEQLGLYCGFQRGTLVPSFQEERAGSQSV